MKFKVLSKPNVWPKLLKGSKNKTYLGLGFLKLPIMSFRLTYKDYII